MRVANIAPCKYMMAAQLQCPLKILAMLIEQKCNVELIKQTYGTTQCKNFHMSERTHVPRRPILSSMK